MSRNDLFLLLAFVLLAFMMTNGTDPRSVSPVMASLAAPADQTVALMEPTLVRTSLDQLVDRMAGPASWRR